jgi:hypothetical protein
MRKIRNLRDAPYLARVVGCDGDRTLEETRMYSMSAISQDVPSAGMAAAIEANWNATFSLVGSSPITELHDAPDLRWYTTPKVPFPLFNHVYFMRVPQGFRRPGPGTSLRNPRMARVEAWSSLRGPP